MALTFSGLAYLVWALVAGISRDSVQDLINTIATTGVTLPRSTSFVKTLFVDAGIAIDLVGLAWLAGSLFLVVSSAKQRFSVSWAWVCAICQTFVAAIGAVLVGWAIQHPYAEIVPKSTEAIPPTAWQQVTGISLMAALVLAVLVWTLFFIRLLVQRSHWSKRGPSLRDSLRSNVHRL